MTVDEYRHELLACVEHFVDHWRAEMKKNPSQWPKEMDEGEWYEQFLMFMSSEPDAPAEETT